MHQTHCCPQNRHPPVGNTLCDRLETTTRQMQMDVAPVEKENAAGNVATPSKAKPSMKAPSQDGPKNRVPLRALAAKPQEHVAVRAVSAANKRMLDRQPATSFTPAGEQGKLPCLTTRLCHMKQWLCCFAHPCTQSRRRRRAGRHSSSTSRMWTRFVTLTLGRTPSIWSWHKALHLCQLLRCPLLPLPLV